MGTKALQKSRKSKRPVAALHPSGALRAKLIRIGNSRGIRLPKAVIEQAGLTDKLEITVRDGEVVIQSPPKRRAGWTESIKAAVKKHGHDVDEEFLNMPNDFDEKEWTW